MSVTQPILVCMVWRGGERFERCLASLGTSAHYFQRIVLSVTSAPDSEDVTRAEAFAANHHNVEVLCTGREMPTMEHQAYWVSYLESVGVSPTEWIYWLAYDDEVRATGVEQLVDHDGNWPLIPGTAYFGPWAMRHEKADQLFNGPWDADLESWTAFPVPQPTQMPVIDWVRLQLAQPTYMQMSGAVMQFGSYLTLRDHRPRKTGPMRIEMAAALSPPTRTVAEFAEPVAIIYGRPNSDRASYGRAARKEDLHLIGWLLRHQGARPSDWPAILRLAWTLTSMTSSRLLARKPPAEEEWRVRGMVAP